MELRHLRYFVAVAEELNFGRAAARVNISQPPLSQQIQQLELELGIQLFMRTNRKVELTQAGVVFLENAYKVLNQVENACEQARKAYLGEQGQLIIGVTGSALYDLIPLLQSFKTRYPQVEVVMHEMSTPMQLKALSAGTIQIGFACTPIKDDDVVVHPFRKQNFIVVLPTNHPMAEADTPIDIRALANDTFIMIPREVGSVYYDTIIGIFHKAGISPPTTLSAHISVAVSAFVSAGLGLALVPQSLKQLTVNGVIYKEISDTSTVIETAVIHRKADYSHVVASFIHFVDEFNMSD